jgi:asparagine synthase (glutamine-hydrolysing)
MCGIAGYVGTGRLAPERIARALALMRHRGPDHQAHRAWDTPDGRRVELLHARLSIIDLDPRANQPFNVDSRWMAYNGELYNYLEVRAALGGGLRTESDTEVLLAALERGGWEALERCEGMWAFATYDECSGELGLSRDRFGEKPLYLLRTADGLLFGSEPKFLFALVGGAPPQDRAHLARYLVNGYKALHKVPATFWEGLEELPAGTNLLVDASGERRVRYWSPPAPDPADMSFEEAVAGTRERLVRAVELRLRADVPLAFCMSGGVDSLSLIATARRCFDYDVHGFTVVNEDERYEESAMVDLAVAELGLRHTTVPLETTDFLARLRALVRHHDGPVATISYYAHWLLMQRVHAAGYRVSVSGTAADEIFTGYYDHHLAYLREAGTPEGRAAWERHVLPVVRNPYLRDPDLFVDDPSFRGHIYLDADAFAAMLRVPFAEPFRECAFTSDVLRNRMLNELTAESVPVILNEDDLNAMSVSIENRSPFLDRELVEFAARIPTRHLVRDGRAKAVLREAMREIAPDPVLDNRRKVGFNAPIGDLLDRSDPAVRADVLADSPVWELVRRDAVEAILDAPELPNSRSKFLFSFLNVKLFLEEAASWN